MLMPRVNLGDLRRRHWAAGIEFEYLEKAYAEQDTELMACIRLSAFHVLRGDPRFKELMRRPGLPD